MLKRRTAFYICAGNIICWLFGNCWTACISIKEGGKKKIHNTEVIPEIEEEIKRLQK
jgi:hypothetical protein